MADKLINGTALATKRKEAIKKRVESLKAKFGRAPRLAVILVGDDAASHVYVGHKERACMGVGIQSESFKLPAATTEKELLTIIERLNNDKTIDGILPQLPVPDHISKTKVIAAIDPRKDVDGLTFENQGLLAWNLPGLYPCTPAGVMELLKEYKVKTEGAVAAVIGRSLLVGSPMATMLSHAGATVIMMQKKTRDARGHCLSADIVVCATGVKHLVRADWIKPGAVVVDVGIHRDESGKLTGDVDFSGVEKVASLITPVPGGVGPMTIVMLLENCLTAFERSFEK